MDPLSILKNLISIPSVNPMGRDLTGPEFFETNLTVFLCDFFKNLGVEYEAIEVAPGRSNVLARFTSEGASTTVLMDAHQDTVPVDGMIIDPFDPVEKDSKLYGRGACDVKGGMAAMLAAFTRLVEEKPAGAANVVMSCSCDEEATIMGVAALRDLLSGDTTGTILDPKPDIGLISEPTDLDIVVAHRGATRWKIITRGRACHSSKPSEGINAIYRMAKVLECLEEYADKLKDIVPAHPMCGSATLSVGVIEGGISVNTVPDECSVDIDRRVIPGEDGTKVIQPIADFLKERLDFEVEMSAPWIEGVSLDNQNTDAWSDKLMEHIEAVDGKPHEKMGVAYGTNASRISAGGVPSMVFGPGSINQAHTKDEWISIDELEKAAEVYYRFCASAG